MSISSATVPVNRNSGLRRWPLAALLLAVLAGCSTGDHQPPINVVTVKSHDYAYEVNPEIPSGLTRFRLVNHGQEGHHMVVFHLPDTMSIATFHRLMAGGAASRNGIESLGGPEGHDGPLQDSTVILPTVDDRVVMWLDPGRYMLACMIPVHGGDDFHIDRGMFHPLSVRKSGVARAEPDFDAVVTMQDHSFDLSAPLRPGRRTVKIVNTGTQEHNLLLDRLHPGRTREDYFSAPEWVGVADYQGGIARMSPGRTAYLDVDIEPGAHIMTCVTRDPTSGRGHWELGMVLEFQVLP